MNLRNFTALALSCASLFAGGPKFRHRFISRELPATTGFVGDYGETALVDLDRDGDFLENLIAPPKKH